MLKQFSHFFVWLLLVLMPLQALAASNMLVCNSIMQAQPTKATMPSDEMASMSCHKHKANDIKHQETSKSPCKTNCAKVCANLCALTALASEVKLSFVLENSQAYDLNKLIYVSITQSNSQRPPTFLA
jgi:hypothetical protein